MVMGSYALSLFVFTVIVNLCLMPLNIKQQKSTSKMTILQPEIKELQEKYKDDKQKLQEETMKIYQREKYNPMSGCFPLLIQMPILFGMIDVIYNPLRHLLNLPAQTIELAQNILARLDISRTYSGFNVQLAIISAIKEQPEAFSALGPNALASISNLNMTLFGMDLTAVPSVSMLTGIFSGGWDPLVLIPIFSGISALIMSLISMRNMVSAPNGPNMKGMMYMMPVFSLMISFSVAGGVGLYWCYSNIVGIGRTTVMNKLYNPKEMAEKAKAEFERRKEEERKARIEARKQAKESGLDGKDKKKGMTAKEINRMKLAEARKRDAEKYGEEYVEVTDKDLV
ncbi:MAG: YidC/Oxa1 family membrane protein insertase [Oscillospiraceae bacterium]|nr:YidC/Oxa1 family membrane protein insertase [Oscillospiraceae bacterium]